LPPIYWRSATTLGQVTLGDDSEVEQETECWIGARIAEKIG
jgi:hypothetical protein